MRKIETVTVGLIAEMTVIVTPQMTVGHFVQGMPLVYGTPIMILHMEIAAGNAIGPLLPPGHVSVGMEVNVRHLAATPVGAKVRTTARVIEVDGKRVLFAVEAWNDKQKIGDGTHRRGIVKVDEFEQRFAVREGMAAWKPDRAGSV